MPVVNKLAIIGQGLIGSSITRAAREYDVAGEIAVTDASPKIRDKVKELGLGEARVVATNRAAVDGADLVVICVPVRRIGKVVQEIGESLKKGAIVTDVGSTKVAVIADAAPCVPEGVHFIPAHPLAGTERSGPESGLMDMFQNQWCILTPPDGASPAAIEKVKAFWQGIGSFVEIMTPEHHDYVLAITSHVPHLIAFAIFHTALRHEKETGSEVMKFSAGGFRDFTRIASSNPTMWRDIFLSNKEPVLDILSQLSADISRLSEAIRSDDGETIFNHLSTSRLARRKAIEREHISVKSKPKPKPDRILSRPYSSDD